MRKLGEEQAHTSAMSMNDAKYQPIMVIGCAIENLKRRPIVSRSAIFATRANASDKALTPVSLDISVTLSNNYGQSDSPLGVRYLMLLRVVFVCWNPYSPFYSKGTNTESICDRAESTSDERKCRRGKPPATTRLCQPVVKVDG